MKQQEKIKYEVLIVLCASALDEESKMFDELGSDKETKEPIYTGGQIRMQAAADIKDKVDKFIVVGGGAEKEYCDSNFRKTNDMKQFLCQNDIPLEKIIRIASEADTTGNLHAIKKLKILKRLKAKNVAILTNFYHLPRAMMMASKIFKEEQINFIPISAEAVIQKQHPSYSFYTKEFLFRIYREINGLRDWENEIYGGKKRWDKESVKWYAHCHKEDDKF